MLHHYPHSFPNLWSGTTQLLTITQWCICQWQLLKLLEREVQTKPRLCSPSPHKHQGLVLFFDIGLGISSSFRIESLGAYNSALYSCKDHNSKLQKYRCLLTCLEEVIWMINDPKFVGILDASFASVREVIFSCLGPLSILTYVSSGKF